MAKYDSRQQKAESWHPQQTGNRQLHKGCEALLLCSLLTGVQCTYHRTCSHQRTFPGCRRFTVTLLSASPLPSPTAHTACHHHPFPVSTHPYHLPTIHYGPPLPTPSSTLHHLPPPLYTPSSLFKCWLLKQDFLVTMQLCGPSCLWRLSVSNFKSQLCLDRQPHLWCLQRPLSGSSADIYFFFF